jgi:CheY-like chemotaxis protein
MIEDKKTILIVDDEPDTCTYFSSLLEDNGFDTVIAYDGIEGMKKVQEKLPEVITLDISMPEKSGVKMYRELKENEKWRNIPVIIVTGISDDFQSFISSRKQVPPPEGYLSKPIDTEKFLQIIRDLSQKTK